MRTYDGVNVDDFRLGAAGLQHALWLANELLGHAQCNIECVAYFGHGNDHARPSDAQERYIFTKRKCKRLKYIPQAYLTSFTHWGCVFDWQVKSGNQTPSGLIHVCEWVNPRRRLIFIFIRHIVVYCARLKKSIVALNFGLQWWRNTLHFKI